MLLVPLELIMNPGDDSSSDTNTTCDAIFCGENYRGRDLARMYVTTRVPIMLRGMIQVVQIHITSASIVR